jgi:hypothetical protein
MPLMTAVCALVLLARPAVAEPLALHPDNPHYFLLGGRPTVLITSGEHYGAVLNRDFDYVKYLDELQAHGLNLTRTFTGAYAEDAQSFGIVRNTLAPLEGRLICPWARSEVLGYAGGGAKFDLEKWDPEYFSRLKDFLVQAAKRGVVVELNLFCPFYKDEMWQLSPMNAANNVNKVGELDREAAYNRETNGNLQAVQETLVRKLARELNEFDNLYYEVCNEPYFGGVTEDWQHRIVDVIVEEERSLPNKHLISLNIANGAKQVTDPHPGVSIFNFHYASPPDAVTLNYGLNRVIGDNETGFKGPGDEHYRMEGWEFMLAGGGLYNNLDYSFAVGYEDGSFEGREKSPGGGGLEFRRQLKVLKDFLESFDFVRMKPDDVAMRGGLPPNGRVRVLSEPGQQYAAYVFGGPTANLSLALPAGRYQAEWIDPSSGKTLKTETVIATDAATTMQSPAYDPDIALRLRRVE